MVLTAAFEFDPRSNKEATIRPTDNIEVPQVIANINTMCTDLSVWSESVLLHCPEFKGKYYKKGRLTSSMHHKQRVLSLLQLIRELGNINVKKKEPPFCYPYSLKARVLVLAHLARMDVSEELEEGRTLKIWNIFHLYLSKNSKQLIDLSLADRYYIFCETSVSDV